MAETNHQDFLQTAGWGDAARTPITSDWSPRRYWRLTKDSDETAILMQSPKENLPGQDLNDFFRLAAHLRGLHLSAPEIYAVDFDTRLCLLEDFGDRTIADPEIEKDAYEAAVDVLAIFRNTKTTPLPPHPASAKARTEGPRQACASLSPSSPHTGRRGRGQGEGEVGTDTFLILPAYKDTHIYKKLSLFCDDPKWLAAWDAVESALPPCPGVFAHMDYRAGNLHWLERRKGEQRIGLLDFQAASRAPFVYDLVTLLEDARRDIDPEFRRNLKDRFIDALPDDQQAMTDDWYVVIAAQYLAGLLGQIAGQKEAAPDIKPRLQSRLRDALFQPVLKPVHSWLEKGIS